ncbi:MAG: twin-arginine translocation signal domain-containing protein, partial [Anaerolineales bacterium]|nr:twin-arginine translocation signal domain-containing protein [Anaerolineales bacterium]
TLSRRDFLKLASLVTASVAECRTLILRSRTSVSQTRRRPSHRSVDSAYRKRFPRAKSPHLWRSRVERPLYRK